MKITTYQQLDGALLSVPLSVFSEICEGVSSSLITDFHIRQADPHQRHQQPNLTPSKDDVQSNWLIGLSKMSAQMVVVAAVAVVEKKGCGPQKAMANLVHTEICRPKAD